MKTQLIICSQGEKDLINLLRCYGVDLTEVIEETLPKLILTKNQPDNNCTVGGHNLICSKCGEPVNLSLTKRMIKT